MKNNLTFESGDFSIGIYFHRGKEYVRVTHIPTGVTACSHSEPSTKENRMKAAKIVKEQLLRYKNDR